jgi:hypothetical protein
MKFCEGRLEGFLWDVKEVIPPNAPEPRGNYVHVSAFINANHAGNLVTHKSHTGILLFINKALVRWYSKQKKYSGDIYIWKQICSNVNWDRND